MTSAYACVIGTALLGAAGASAQNAQAATTDVKVLLFRTEAVQRVQVYSRNAAFRLCDLCAEQHGPVSLDLHLQGRSMLDASDHRIEFVQLRGEVEISTSSGNHAQAAGQWNISAEHDRLRISVLIPRERYVQAVLSAEASSNEPQESLKALAVVARSFAATAGSARHESGALCDTTHCQALRLGPVAAPVREAVWSTSGETLWFGNKQVTAYFSQSCGGYTEDASTVWGGPAKPWLTAHVDPWCFRTPAQWRASFLEADVRRALAAEGFALTQPILSITPVQRDRSGRVQQLRIQAAISTKTLPAAIFRFAVNRSLGWNQIRSDRYQVHSFRGKFIFDGVGLGHGVGLCQAGASAMARAGKSYRDILQMYFPGAVMRVRQSDTGWVTLPTNGFVLRSTVHDATLQNEAARAFTDARARWPQPLRVKPILTVFPSTEAFRQATGQPGWDLAVTQGDQIATQPPEILRARGGEALLFRHEFLHSFVEANAAATAPLWLREGLVEVLNGEQCSKSPALSTDAVDADLRNATTMGQSQRAHADACALVKQFVAHHGTGATLDFLKRH